jgi:excisionase family DNA binding protein
MDDKIFSSAHSSESEDVSGVEFSFGSDRIKSENMKGKEMAGEDITQQDSSEPSRGGSSAKRIRWVSTKDAASMLGVTLRTLYRFIDDGELPAYKLGRVIRLQESDIYAFIESARITPGELEHLHPEPSTQNKGKKTRGRPSSREGQARDIEVPAVS